MPRGIFYVYTHVTGSCAYRQCQREQFSCFHRTFHAINKVVLTAKLGTIFFYRRPHYPGILFLAEVREWLIDERCFVQTSFGTGRSLQGRHKSTSFCFKQKTAYEM